MGDSNVELLKQAFTVVQKKNDKEKVDNSINVKPAKVIGVDEDTHKVFVYFIDDTEQNTYTFYNKSGEVLSEGDNVKIYYTTNPAKGWIGARCGEPNIKQFENVENFEGAYTTAIAFRSGGFDLTFVSGGKTYTNEFAVTEDSAGNITKITNETAGREITVTYDG